MASLSDEPFPSLPIRLPPHPHPFDFGSVREVPDSHAWPDHPSADPSGPDAIPVIDLAAPGAAGLIARACESWGVFHVTGHGVPAGLLDALDAQVRRLFSLPTAQKLRAARPDDGVAGYGMALLSSFFSKLMWSEGFTIAGSPLDNARKLWPEDHAQFCDVIDEYDKQMKELAGRLTQMMLLSLGLAEEGVKLPAGPTDGLREVSAVLQLNWYPPCPDPDRAMGLAAHTDSGLLTVLYQSSNSSGLQVGRDEARDGPAHWVAVPPLPGSLIVIIGDLGQILSNGRFRGGVHRAVVNRACHRLSAAYICGPPGHVRVSPAVGGRPLYRGVTWHEYLGLKARFFDKALASIKVADEDHNSAPL